MQTPRRMIGLRLDADGGVVVICAIVLEPNLVSLARAPRDSRNGALLRQIRL